jgi:hypothetical protein
MNESDFFSDGLIDAPPMTCLGMSLDGSWSSDRSGIPCDALVVSRSMLDGNFAYQIITTKGIGAVDCLGMLRWAQMILEAGMFVHTESTSDDDDEEGEAA